MTSPSYLIRVRLGDPSHRMRFLGTARWFGAPGSAEGVHDGVETVDKREAFWLACLRDGSIVEAEAGPAPGTALILSASANAAAE